MIVQVLWVLVACAASGTIGLMIGCCFPMRRISDLTVANEKLLKENEMLVDALDRMHYDRVS